MEGSVGEETESLLIFLTLARQGHRRTLQLLFVALRSGNLCSSLEPSFVGDFEQAAQSYYIDQLPFSPIYHISDRDKEELHILDSGFRKSSPSLWRKHGRRVSSMVERGIEEVEAPSGLSSFSIPSLASARFRMHLPLQSIMSGNP